MEKVSQIELGRWKMRIVSILLLLALAGCAAPARIRPSSEALWHVEGLRCLNCALSVISVLGNVPGVMGVKADPTKGLRMVYVQVNYDPTVVDEASIRRQLEGGSRRAFRVIESPGT